MLPKKADNEAAKITNVINGVFGEKQATVKKAEKQSAEQDNTEKDAPTKKHNSNPSK